jgi:phage-related minor tail protein
MANLSSLNFRLSANIAPFRKGLNKAERSMDKLGRKMQQTGKNLSMKLTAPIAALGAMSFSVFKGFEQEMSKVQAVSGATAEEFKSLSDNAKELGASTMFSAREVAGLQGEFAKLGFTATEITKVTEATLSLAQASGSDLARAAMVAGSTLRAFGLDASQTGMVTDVMAKSFSTSAMDMDTFAESMKFVAPVAKSAGMSIQETSAMLSVLANAGIKGSQAGTALRRIISEIGASGKPTAEALKDLAAQGLNLADAKDEVGRSAQSALLVLAGGVDQIAPLTEEFNNSAGAAKAMADIMGATAFGASKRLESAMEGLGISIGEIVAVAVVPLIESLAKAASNLNGMSKTSKTFAIAVAVLETLLAEY